MAPLLFFVCYTVLPVYPSLLPVCSSVLPVCPVVLPVCSSVLFICLSVSPLNLILSVFYHHDSAYLPAPPFRLSFYFSVCAYLLFSHIYSLSLYLSDPDVLLCIFFTYLAFCPDLSLYLLFSYINLSLLNCITFPSVFFCSMQLLVPVSVFMFYFSAHRPVCYLHYVSQLHLYVGTLK